MCYCITQGQQQGAANAPKSQSLSRNSWQRAEPGGDSGRDCLSPRPWELGSLGDARLSVAVSRVVGCWVDRLRHGCQAQIVLSLTLRKALSGSQLSLKRQGRTQDKQ